MYPPSNNAWNTSMLVVHTAAEPPNQGKMDLLTINCIWNSKNALRNDVNANSNVSVLRGLGSNLESLSWEESDMIERNLLSGMSWIFCLLKEQSAIVSSIPLSVNDHVVRDQRPITFSAPLLSIGRPLTLEISRYASSDPNRLFISFFVNDTAPTAVFLRVDPIESITWVPEFVKTNRVTAMTISSGNITNLSKSRMGNLCDRRTRPKY